MRVKRVTFTATSHPRASSYDSAVPAGYCLMKLFAISSLLMMRTTAAQSQSDKSRILPLTHATRVVCHVRPLFDETFVHADLDRQLLADPLQATD